MKQIKEEKTIVDFASDIIDMQYEILELRSKVQRLEKTERDYLSLLKELTPNYGKKLSLVASE